MRCSRRSARSRESRTSEPSLPTSLDARAGEGRSASRAATRAVAARGRRSAGLALGGARRAAGEDAVGARRAVAAAALLGERAGRAVGAASAAGIPRAARLAALGFDAAFAGATGVARSAEGPVGDARRRGLAAADARRGIDHAVVRATVGRRRAPLAGAEAPAGEPAPPRARAVVAARARAARVVRCARFADLEAARHAGRHVAHREGAASPTRGIAVAGAARGAVGARLTDRQAPPAGAAARIVARRAIGGAGGAALGRLAEDPQALRAARERDAEQPRGGDDPARGAQNTTRSPSDEAAIAPPSPTMSPRSLAATTPRSATPAVISATSLTRAPSARTAAAPPVTSAP